MRQQVTHLKFVCECQGTTLSQLGDWPQWYITGETWVETCRSCGVAWAVELTATELATGRPPVHWLDRLLNTTNTQRRTP